MLILGYRIQPLRSALRAWIWLTAPRSSRHKVFSEARACFSEIRSLTDGEIAAMAHRCPSTSYSTEIARRGIDPTSQWLRAVTDLWPKLAAMNAAEKVLRPN
jgi:hypothetical protein